MSDIVKAKNELCTVLEAVGLAYMDAIKSDNIRIEFSIRRDNGGLSINITDYLKK